LAKGVETIKTTATSVKNTVQNTYQDVVTETNKAIEEKQKEKGQNAAASVNVNASATTTTTTTTTDANELAPVVTDMQSNTPAPQ
jgi:hypothetical protein